MVYDSLSEFWFRLLVVAVSSVQLLVSLSNDTGVFWSVVR